VTPKHAGADAELERIILSLLEQRAPTSTICPSDAARALDTADDWRDLMGPARAAAQRLAKAGEVEITQAERSSTSRLPGDLSGSVGRAARRYE